MKNILTTILFCLFLTLTVFTQTQQKPCSSAEAKQFDFWVGTWDLEWKDAKGEKATGTNTINKILGGCVIEENFSTSAEPLFIGKSSSVFNAASGRWNQTWVDNAGSYLDLVGEFKNGEMTLWRDAADKDGKKIRQRMIFYNISKDDFDWNWESSADDGKTWKLLWKIHYKRRK